MKRLEKRKEKFDLRKIAKSLIPTERNEKSNVTKMQELKDRKKNQFISFKMQRIYFKEKKVKKK